jgi:hypothetical protein
VAPSCTAVHAASIVDVARAATERASTTVGFRLSGFPIAMARLAPSEAAIAIHSMRMSRRLLNARMSPKTKGPAARATATT